MTSTMMMTMAVTMESYSPEFAKLRRLALNRKKFRPKMILLNFSINYSLCVRFSLKWSKLLWKWWMASKRGYQLSAPLHIFSEKSGKAQFKKGSSGLEHKTFDGIIAN